MTALVSINPARTRVVRHDSALGRWELVRRAPDSRLRSHVIEFAGYVETAAHRPIRRREVPWPGVVLIVNFGPPFRITDPGARSGPADFGSFAAGLYDRHVVTESTGLSCCLQVNFTPIGARRFFGLPMDTLANRVVGLDQVMGGEARALAERLEECAGWEDRFAVLDALILSRVERTPPPRADIVWASRRLAQAGGNVSVGTLARELGWSPRRLIAGFREQIGLPPKALARIIRFHRVVGWLGNRDEVRWAELAQRAGYYDQAHFNRDFRELTGSTPGQFLRSHHPDDGNVMD